MKPISFTSSSRAQVYIKRGIAILLTVVLVVGGGLFLQELTRVKKSQDSRDMLQKSYFEDPGEYDVLFLGTSHVLYSISPLEIWNEYGITSYNWGSPTCNVPTTYWKLVNLLDYHTPKLVVVDCYRSSWEEKTYNETRAHQALDAFPLSYHKYQAIKDLIEGQTRTEDKEEYTRQEQINLLFPISAYHTRWEDLGQRDFVNISADTKGSELKVSVAKPIEISQTTDSTEITDSMQGVIYLKKIIELCQSRNIPLLLTYLPFPVSDTWKMEANMISDVAKEYNAQYLDCTKIDLLDYNTDCHDTDSHINALGVDKVSSYIGQYIIDNYDVGAGNLDESIREKWDTDYLEYRRERESLVFSQYTLSSYLMLLHNTSLNTVIEIKNSDVIRDEVYGTLIRGINEDVSIDEHTTYLVVIDGKAYSLEDFTDDNKSYDTEIGTFSIKNDGESHNLFLGDEEIYKGTNAEYSLGMRVTDGAKQIDNATFIYKRDENGKSYNDVLIRPKD